MTKKNKVTANDEAKSLRSLLPKGVLGDLEVEIMEHMWDIKQARVRHVYRLIDQKRPIAYTTVMTVMGHLVEKGLLTRTSEGNRYIYQISQSRYEFLQNVSRKAVRGILNDFGDLAIAGFLGEIRKAKPEKLDELKSLLREAIDESSPS